MKTVHMTYAKASAWE